MYIGHRQQGACVCLYPWLLINACAAPAGPAPTHACLPASGAPEAALVDPHQRLLLQAFAEAAATGKQQVGCAPVEGVCSCKPP